MHAGHIVAGMDTKQVCVVLGDHVKKAQFERSQTDVWLHLETAPARTISPRSAEALGDGLDRLESLPKARHRLTMPRQLAVWQEPDVEM